MSTERADESFEERLKKEAEEGFRERVENGPPVIDELSADSFRSSVHGHEQEETTQREEAHRHALDKRHHEVSEMVAADLSDATWGHMLHDARIAAAKGEKEHMLLSFPCELCTDHGRAVNMPDRTGRRRCAASPTRSSCAGTGNCGRADLSSLRG